MKGLTSIKVRMILTGMLFFLTGMVIPQMVHWGKGSYTGILSLFAFRIYQNAVLKRKELLYYVLKQRLRMLLFLWLGKNHWMGLFFHFLMFYWTMLSLGTMTALFLLKYGYAGLIILMGYLMPQWIFYYLMWKKEWEYFFRMRYIGDHSHIMYVVVGGLCVAGCIAEVYPGLWLTQFICRYYELLQ